MKIKVYTIDFKIPRWLKQLFIFAIIPTVGLFFIGRLVEAAGIVKTDFKEGDLLSAKEINDNFKSILEVLNAPVSINPSQILSGTLPASVTVANASQCKTCGAADGALELRISAIESALASHRQIVGGNYTERTETVPSLPTGPLIKVSLNTPSSGYVMAVATTRVCAFDGDIWLALSTKANDVPLVGRVGPYGFARVFPSEKYCESVTLSRTFPVQSGLTTVYVNVQAIAAVEPEFVAPTLSAIFYKERLE